MKRFFLTILLLLTVFFTSCSKETDTNGDTPKDIPVRWANAMVQKDSATRYDLLIERTTALKPDKSAENDSVIKEYKLTEWKANNEKYFYEIVFVNPTEKKTYTEKMEIVKTDSGWKRKEFLNIRNFELIVENLKPSILREMHEE
jgi:hypothetical protein